MRTNGRICNSIASTSGLTCDRQGRHSGGNRDFDVIADDCEADSVNVGVSEGEGDTDGDNETDSNIEGETDDDADTEGETERLGH